MPSDLGQFCLDELFKVWSKNREPIEEKWQRNEDAFNGVSKRFWKVEEGQEWRSNTFIQITKVKVLSAYAIVIDILLKGGMVPFSLELSPWDRVILEELPEEQQSQIQDSISDMSSLIKQQIIDCRGDRELIKCVMSAAKLGETYFKSYVHTVKRKGFGEVDMGYQGMDPQRSQDFMRWQPQEKEITAPAFSYVSNWNMFRDMESDDMQKNRGVCQMELVSPYGLQQLLGKEDQYYIDAAIKRVLRDYSKASGVKGDTKLPPGLRKIKGRHNNIVKREFWCRVPRHIVEGFEGENKDDKKPVSALDEPDYEGDEIEVGVCMAGDEVIRLVKTDPDTRPHGRVVWEVNLDENFGIGPADNAEQTQLALNGMVRAFEDNKKLSANVMLALKTGGIINWDGKFQPGTAIEIGEEINNITEVVHQLIVQDVGVTLLDGISLMERFTDDTTMLPKILQGAVMPKQKPDTLGELHLLEDRASKYTSSVLKNFDEGMLEPIITRFYEYNMMDPDVKRGKGNYIAKASGYASYQDRVIKASKMLQAIQLSLSSPEIAQEVRMKKLIEAAYRALDIDPDEVFKTPEEKAQDQAAMQQSLEAQNDQMVALLLAKNKAETEKIVAGIMAKLDTKLKEMETAHRHKMEQLDNESENRIVEKRLEPKDGGKAK